MRSDRSSGFFKPAKTILVPGINFLGFSKYLNKFSAVQTTPEFYIWEKAVCGTIN
jgi:hypothetical protein